MLKKYLKELKKRRQNELAMLSNLTGKGYDDWDLVAVKDEEKSIPAVVSYQTLSLVKSEDKKTEKNILFAAIGILGK